MTFDSPVDMKVDQAIEVFCRGFCVTRSFTHPYIASRVGPLWLMHDDPPKRVDARANEFVAYGIDPEEAVRIIEDRNLARHFLSAISDVDDCPLEVKDAYKALGYRVLRKEPLMARPVHGVALKEGPIPVRRVESLEEAAMVRETAGRTQILPEHVGVDDAPIRLYFVEDSGKAIAFVRSIPVGSAAWVSNLWVDPKYRRRGIASALMTTMLVDDRTHGIETSVLTASESGAALYETLGYQQLGLLQLFSPRR